MIIRPAKPADLQDIAKLISIANQQAERQCIHSSLGDSPESLLGEIEKWYAIEEIVFIVVEENGQIDAVIGSEFDQDLGRSWLWGPHVNIEPWQDIAKQLFQALRSALPNSIRQLDAYLNIKNQRRIDFYHTLGFSQTQLAHVYESVLPITAQPPINYCPPLAPTWHGKFIEMHSTIFPNAYFTADRIISQIDDRHQVFIYTHGEEALGYIYASIWEDGQTGEVEFLGVQKAYRRQGIGRALLLTALYWLFTQHRVSNVQLTVNTEKSSARSLYQSVGFRLLYSGVGLCKILE